MRGTEARIFISDLDFSSSTSELSVETTTTEIESATLTSQVADYAPTINDGKISVNGYFYGVSPSLNEAVMYAAMANPTKIVSAIFDYQNLPCPAYVIENAFGQDMNWSAPVDGLITMNGTFHGKSGMKRGLLMQYKTSRAAAAAGTAVQIPGVLSTMAIRSYVFIHSVVGTQSTAITCKIQNSANGTSGWSDKATFSFGTSVTPGAQAAAITSPTGEYFNLNVTSLGGATSFTVSWILSVTGLT